MDLFVILFGCWHNQLSRVFTIQGRTYRVCCNCGAKFDYSLEHMAMRRGLRRLANDNAGAASPPSDHRVLTKRTVESLV